MGVGHQLGFYNMFYSGLTAAKRSLYRVYHIMIEAGELLSGSTAATVHKSTLQCLSPTPQA